MKKAIGFNYSKCRIALLVLALLMVRQGGFSQMTLVYPSGSEILAPGTHHDILWSYSYGENPPVTIKLSLDSGATWSVVASGVTHSGYQWIVPNTPSTNCLIKIVDINDTGSCISNTPFTIGGTALAIAGINIQNADTVVCYGSTTVIEATGTPPGGTFTWFYDDLIYGPYTNVVNPDSQFLVAIDTLSNGLGGAYGGEVFNLAYTNNGYSDTIWGAVSIFILKTQLDTAELQQACTGNQGYIHLLDTLVYFGIPDTYSLVKLTYLWSDGDTSAFRNNLGGGIYTVTASNYLGCTTAYTFNLAQGPQVVITSATGGNLPDTLAVSVTGGAPPYRFLWSNGDTSEIIYLGAADYGGYFVTVTDNNGCATTASLLEGCPNQCVWPGDANYDGIANNLDLLAIGLAYDSSGPVRAGASIAWVAQMAQNWTDTLPGGINYKHVDCNGDGIINADDTVAIIQNYSLTHPRSDGYTAPQDGAPLLYPSVTEDTVFNGDTLTVQLILGSPAIQANNVYGIAFTLNYYPVVVDTGKTTITFGNSWLGTSIDKISIAKDLKQTGELECALTRIDHTTESGQGPIGVATFVITTDNINGKTFSYFNERFYISDITMVDNAGNVLPVNTGNDSVQVGYLLAGSTHQSDINSRVHVNPNPANSRLAISSEQLAMEQIRILDMLGMEVMRNVYSPDTMATKQQLDISNLTPGIYTVEVLTDKGVAVQKLIIAR